jgi:aryl-alcohol dehydrogenase-like predicted oxidoreductase
MRYTLWGSLDGGVLTEKYLDGGEGRITTLDRDITESQHAVAREVVAVADDLDVSAAQVALAWIRHQPGQLLPILGATTPEQLRDMLASVDISLDDPHLARLDEVSAVERGFPHEFLADETIERLVFGGTRDRIDPYTE